MSETLEPEELLKFMNSYFKRVDAVIHDNEGFVYKFIGEAIMLPAVDLPQQRMEDSSLAQYGAYNREVL